MIEQWQEYFIPYSISNAVALTVVLLAWKVTTAARIALGIIFLLASITNAWVTATNPTDYLNYRNFVVLNSYQEFIDGWFADFTRPIVFGIAAGQLLIAVCLFLSGRMLKLGIIGVVIFGLAIAPLGIGSAFPCSIVLAIAAALLWRRHDTARFRN